MKAAMKSIGNVFAQIDTNFDNAMLNWERKVCGGKTVDERLDQMDDAVVNVTKRAAKRTSTAVKPVTDKIAETVKKVPVPSPFRKCEDSQPVQPKVKPAPQVVKAIPTTQYCPFCRELIPVEASFCPHCRGQIEVPVAGVSKAVPTACKIKGMPPVQVSGPAKRTLGQKIKGALTCNVSLLTKPFAQVKGTRVK